MSHAGGKKQAAQPKQPTQAELIRQNQQYSLIESDDEDYGKLVKKPKKKVRFEAS